MATDYWQEHADKLSKDLVDCDHEFVASASLAQITEKAGAWFAGFSENTRASIVSTMRAAATVA